LGPEIKISGKMRQIIPKKWGNINNALFIQKIILHIIFMCPTNAQKWGKMAHLKPEPPSVITANGYCRSMFKYQKDN
jgi:hypothetical protein